MTLQKWDAERDRRLLLAIYAENKGSAIKIDHERLAKMVGNTTRDGIRNRVNGVLNIEAKLLREEFENRYDTLCSPQAPFPSSYPSSRVDGTMAAITARPRPRPPPLGSARLRQLLGRRQLDPQSGLSRIHRRCPKR